MTTFNEHYTGTDQIVRSLHVTLETLGLPSPLAPAVAVLDRSVRLDVARMAGTSTARGARAQLARDIAAGRREFDDLALAEWQAGDCWVADGAPEGAGRIPAATLLIEQVRQAARNEAANLLSVHSPAVFDTIRTAAAAEIARLEPLPAPPAQLWQHPDPTRLLARTPGHEATLSVLASVDDRFWQLVQLSGSVRDAAGYGGARFPDGAPTKVAATYRDWRKAQAGMDDLRAVRRALRLWKTVVDGWQPGVWRPEDIKAPTRAENTFGAKLARLGGAVGVNQ